MRTEQMKYRRRGYGEASQTLNNGHYGDGHEGWIGCYQDEEREVQARLAKVQRERPAHPVVTIEPLGSSGPYMLIYTESGWYQTLVFKTHAAARYFIRTLRQTERPANAKPNHKPVHADRSQEMQDAVC